jgi:hypothetical protein
MKKETRETRGVVLRYFEASVAAVRVFPFPPFVYIKQPRLVTISSAAIRASKDK